MTTYVLVHGAWSGAHSWRNFAPLLWQSGHEVFAPCLTGLGERSHLANPDVDLSLHTLDVLNLIAVQDLHDIVLVGHSYGGMVVTGVADRAPERIRHLVFEDAFLPRDGESCWTPDMVARSVGEDGWSIMRPQQVPYRPPSGGPVTRPPQLFPQPRRTLEEPVRLSTPLEKRAFSRTYVKAAGNPRTPPAEQTGSFWEAAARVKSDPAWSYHELACGHGIHREMPKEFAQILLALG